MEYYYLTELNIAKEGEFPILDIFHENELGGDDSLELLPLYSNLGKSYA